MTYKMYSSIYSGTADSTTVTETEGYITVWVNNNDFGELAGPITVLGNTVYIVTTTLSYMVGKTSRPVTLVKNLGDPILPVAGFVQID